MQTLLKLNEDGTTILMVTHSAENAAYSHSTIRMLDGRIIGQEQPGARLTLPQNRERVLEAVR